MIQVHYLYHLNQKVRGALFPPGNPENRRAIEMLGESLPKLQEHFQDIVVTTFE